MTVLIRFILQRTTCRLNLNRCLHRDVRMSCPVRAKLKILQEENEQLDEKKMHRNNENMSQFISNSSKTFTPFNLYRVVNERETICSDLANQTTSDDYLFFSKQSFSTGKEPARSSGGNERKPSWEQLQHICLRLSDTMPKFLQIPMDFTFYREDLVFVNKITDQTTTNLTQYRHHIGNMSLYCRVRFPIVDFQVLNVTPMIEEGTVRVRWRIIYKTWLDLFYALVFKLKFSVKDLKKDARWFDAYSIFYVCNEGLVFKHVVDRVMPDDHKIPASRPRQSFLSRLLGVATAKPGIARIHRKFSD